MDGYNIIHRLIKTLSVSQKILSWYLFIYDNNFRVYMCYFKCSLVKNVTTLRLVKYKICFILKIDVYFIILIT